MRISWQSSYFISKNNCLFLQVLFSNILSTDFLNTRVNVNQHLQIQNFQLFLKANRDPEVWTNLIFWHGQKLSTTESVLVGRPKILSPYLSLYIYSIVSSTFSKPNLWRYGNPETCCTSWLNLVILKLLSLWSNVEGTLWPFFIF